MEELDPRPTQVSPLVRRPPGAAPTGAHPAKAKPDARPMRLVLGAGGIAALSALFAAIVVPATPPVTMPTADPQQAVDPTAAGPITYQRPVQYIQLQAGQTAPPGAVVVDPSGPLPTPMVVTVPAPAQKPRIIRTTQSGKVLP